MAVSKTLSSDKWLGFVVNLPTSNTTLRMRLWRAMKGLGCAVLRDSVYLLPAGRGLRQALRVYAEEIRNGGGNAYLLNVSVSSSEERRQFQGMFDRSKEYQALIQKIGNFRETCAALEVALARRQLKNLHRELDRIAGVDYFPKPLRFEAEDLLAEVETTFLSSLFPRADHAGEEHMPPRAREKYQAKRWATSYATHADTLASAWLIERFIDPAARFEWLEADHPCPPGAICFGTADGEFKPDADRCTYQTLLASFGLEGNAGLVRMASIVHCLATGAFEVAEAAGIDRLLKGLQRKYTDIDALRPEASRLFDLLYATYAES